MLYREKFSSKTRYFNENLSEYCFVWKLFTNKNPIDTKWCDFNTLSDYKRILQRNLQIFFTHAVSNAEFIDDITVIAWF